MGTRSEFIEHTSEVGLRVAAPTFAALVEEAGRCTGQLLLRGGDVEARDDRRAIRLHAADRAALLVQFLNELIYLAETDCWIGVRFTATIDDGGATIDATGVRVAEPPSLVKAATYHGLEVRDGPDGVEAEVIFDI